MLLLYLLRCFAYICTCIQVCVSDVLFWGRKNDCSQLHTVKKAGYKNTKKLGITCSILTISHKTLVNVLNILKPYM